MRQFFLNSKSKRLKAIYQNRYLYLMLLPAVVSFLVFCYLPMGGLVLAFKELRYDMPLWQCPNVGLQYFKSFFNNPQAGQLILNTFGISFCKLVLAFPFPIMFAIMLNEVKHSRLKKVAQTISYLPHFVAWVVVAAILDRLLAPDVGLINQLIGFFGGDQGRFFMMESKWFYPIMFISHVWKTIGWDSIIYLAAISTIDPGYYKAAKIDGATKWDEITKITLPCLKPTIGMLFILSLGNVLKAGYEQIYLLRTPGNMIFADILDTYVIRQGLEMGNFGYATAIGLLQSVAGLVMVVTFNRLSKKYTEVSVW